MFPQTFKKERHTKSINGKVVSDYYKIYVYSENGKDLVSIFEIRVNDIDSLIKILKE